MRPGDVWFVYDGDCPFCRMAARGVRVRKAVGELRLLNAREDRDHPILQEIRAHGLDLDEGMVIKFGGDFYHGAEALRVMAMLSTDQGWFNRLNALLFRSPRIAKRAYPVMRGARYLALRLRGVPPIGNLSGR